MDQLEGREVGEFIRKVGVPCAREVLIGCILDNQSSEQGLQITAIRADETIECKSSDDQAVFVKLVHLPRFLVIDERHPARLRRVVDGFLSEHDLNKRHMASELRAYGIRPASVEDAKVLVGVIAHIEAGEEPPFDALQQFYEACKRSAASPDPQQKRRALLAGASVFRAIERMADRIDASVRIKLAFCLRHSGQTQQAIAVTDFIEDRDTMRWVTREAMGILATERAAALADLYELNRSSETLTSALYWARRAYATSSASTEAGLVLRRITSLE
jgi:hypothetical protein